MPKLRRALISVSNKTGIVGFAKCLADHDVEIISTGGTANYLNRKGIDTRPVSDITAFPEILSGRVKTLHPKIFAGLLALRDSNEQMDEVTDHEVELIDLVVVNLYPFEQTVAKADCSHLEALENIDIGGPSLIRAASKNYLDVAVVTSPSQYEELADELNNRNGEVSLQTRKRLASAAFELTARYDSMINSYLLNGEAEEPSLPKALDLRLEKVKDLRYGENPHQRAALYKASGAHSGGLITARQLHGKELSFNNLLDLNAALGLVQEFDKPCVVIIKHTNPCGLAVDNNIHEAFLKARATDPVSSFGGIIGLNRPLDIQTASAIAELFVEAVIAPDFQEDALARLQAKKNLRILESPETRQAPKADFDLKVVSGGFLIQDQDLLKLNDINFKVVSKRVPSKQEWQAMRLGWRVTKWVKSNAIVFASSDRTIGIGAGQMSRVDSSRIAIEKAKRFALHLSGTVVSSDAFFPFRDGVDVAAEAGATAVIQPGGSIQDDEVIQAVNEHDMAMVFTGVRQFKH
ncbi:bifunctional phosphoribosylaminoimidazolecarboxamide formyltransferase/IMP cyclohydrolase [bacterium]|nr:bifunctional phosphoribosylaminoimidazolecarboxamide formyltransferase/IMP cyclohydrolase [bacterium]